MLANTTDADAAGYSKLNLSSIGDKVTIAIVWDEWPTPRVPPGSQVGNYYVSFAQVTNGEKTPNLYVLYTDYYYASAGGDFRIQFKHYYGDPASPSSTTEVLSNLPLSPRSPWVVWIDWNGDAGELCLQVGTLRLTGLSTFAGCTFHRIDYYARRNSGSAAQSYIANLYGVYVWDEIGYRAPLEELCPELV